jgi:LysM repeat protein
MRLPTRVLLITAAVLLPAVAVTACGEDGSSLITLPPIRTTTTTVVPVTTADTTRYFYEIKEGENLNMIAQKFCVPITELIALNRSILPDPNSVPAGATIEIPKGVRMVDCIPASETTAPA